MSSNSTEQFARRGSLAMICLVLGGAILLWLETAEKTLGSDDWTQQFVKSSFMIPMRDGVKLYTEVFVPVNAQGPLPFLFSRTPYGVNDDEGRTPILYDTYKEFFTEGYIFVLQDIRGRVKSEGEFVMLRTPRRNHDGIDEGTDAYDSIDWLLRNIPSNNGRVGMLGSSYRGWLTVMAALEPHPALKAAEQASPADMFLGDDFHHNGAFRLSYGYEYATSLESSKSTTRVIFDIRDTFEWYLRLGALSNVNAKYLHGGIPTWNNFVNHPNYDEFWQRRAVTPYLVIPMVPMLNVTGWWDQEDIYGPLKIFETLEKNDTQHMNYFVAGPWNHGGWWRINEPTLGKINFGSNTALYFRQYVQAPWFAYWLKDKGSLKQSKALTFQTGTNRWKSYEQWPPRSETVDRNLYFQADGRLSFDPPANAVEEFDSYISDPAHPVPYRQRPVQPTYPVGGWPTWQLEDQRFVYLRPDVLSWETDVLTHPFSITGRIEADLFAATSGSDTDWITKVIDVHPEVNTRDLDMGGYQLRIEGEVFRGRFRESYITPRAVLPNQVNEYKIDLHTNNHTFLPGHRIMVQVQSAWFPVIDRNPQKFVPNIFKATGSDYQKATQRVYRSKQYASHIVLPVARD